ncbi:MAG: hypothetical protein Q9187_008333 [Circinaria calcarea]
MQSQHREEFRPNNPFPEDILEAAGAELDRLAAILEREGIKVYRPDDVDWIEMGRYTGAMPLDGLLTVGNHIIESAYAWRCRRGIEYLGAQVPEGYTIKMLEVTNNPHAMHIDTVICPLRQGLLIYCPSRVSEAALRKREILKDWDLGPVPFTPKPRLDPPSSTCSDWLVMNVLVLDGRKVIVDEVDTELCGMDARARDGARLLPAKACQQHGGASHCATMDLIRLT